MDVFHQEEDFPNMAMEDVKGRPPFGDSMLVLITMVDQMKYLIFVEELGVQIVIVGQLQSDLGYVLEVAKQLAH